MKYLKNAAAGLMNPPQSEPLNERQVKNSAGGYAYPVDNWKRLERFLILGSEGGSYYASEQKLTKENLDAVKACVKEDGQRTVKIILEVSDGGRAPKNDPALLALAYCAGCGDLGTRQAALEVLPKVARIGTHLFHFVAFVQEFRGWGRGLKSGIANWYLNQRIDRLAEQVTKYQQRDGFSHRDLMRLCHVEFGDAERNSIARWVVKGGADARTLKDKTGNVVREYPKAESLHPHIQAHEELQACADVRQAAKLIREHGLTRESVPTELLGKPEVWDALLDDMPITALIRNLGNLSKHQLLKPLGARNSEVIKKLTSAEILKRGRVHPIQLLMAAKTYASGHGLRGSGEWTVVPQIVEALDEAYYLAFGNVEPTGKRFYLGLDISGSMWTANVAGIPGFNPAVASGAMAMVAIRLEPEYYAAGFTNGSGQSSWSSRGYRSGLTPISLSKNMRLDTVVSEMQKLSRFMGGTDCALPMLDAIEKKLEVDVFVVYTDSETWAGNVHPTKALERYRQKMGIPAKLVVVGMVSNGFSIADPNDAGMLDVVGFDTATPGVIADFVK